MAGNREILESFFQASGGITWNRADKWLTAEPLSKWHGVHANSNGAVEIIDLNDNQLAGMQKHTNINVCFIQIRDT